MKSQPKAEEHAHCASIQPSDRVVDAEISDPSATIETTIQQTMFPQTLPSSAANATCAKMADLPKSPLILPPGINPYYQDESCAIILGDCREVLPQLERGDGIVTDPPYGLGFQYASYNDTREGWFALMDSVVPLLRASAGFVVMPSCGIDRLCWWYAHWPPDWLIAWFKGSPGHQSPIGFNDWEAHVVWGKPYSRDVHDHFQTPCGFDYPDHPCPKPIEWANWLVKRTVPLEGL